MRHLNSFICLLLAVQVQSFVFFVAESDDVHDLTWNYLEDNDVGKFNSYIQPATRLISRYKRNIDSNEEEEEEDGKDDNWEVDTGDEIKIAYFKVETRITSRFAETAVRRKVINSAKTAKSIQFNVQIPKSAFITNFTMNVNGITFVGSVMEKTTARNLYTQARSRGKAAGIVRTNSYDMETFKTEVHVPPGSIIEFELHYQEMLYRKQGFYEYNLYLQSDKLVPQFKVDIYIFEPTGISFVRSPDFLGDHFKGVTKITHSKQKAHVSFKPNFQQQRKCENCTSSIIDGNFVVTYDVARENIAGELQLSDGYFVHFFAPNDMSPLSKNIIFVIDVSGSMWGLKMKQTVQAMQTILDDLGAEDYFGIIDFNHNVRCWREELVPSDSVYISEAKKYIQDIQPNGGTNINEALLRAIYILSEAMDNGLINAQSVSMIILVSDGDPTVGEIKLSAIQKNVKKKMREEFSLFSLGIGFDVDYDFLERIALENRGIAQRIYANQDASQQLKNFYNQVASPLLKKIVINYPEDGVSGVTQNSFDKFFRGSELVVAGKVETDGALQSFITASSVMVDLSLTVDGSDLDDILAKQKHALPGFARQLWAYITIRQLLAERSLASSAAKKRTVTQKILGLALQHQFVTPMTALLVESEKGNERMLADSPRDSRQGCCSGLTHQGSSSIKPFWAQSTVTPTLPNQRGPEMESAAPPLESIPPHITSVDGDPHFIIHLPKMNDNICFNVDTKPGTILNLVSDPDLGVVVNGQVIAAKKENNKKLNTYFGTIATYFKNYNIYIEVTTEKISVMSRNYSHLFSWTESGNITKNGLTLFVKKDQHVTVCMNEQITFVVMLHRVWKKHPVNVDFLGLYTPSSNMFSPSIHGLIGQFSNEPFIYIYNIHPGKDPQKPEATMEVKGNKLEVTRGWQKHYGTDPVNGTDVYCWFVHNNGKGIIDGHFMDYVVPSLNSFPTPPKIDYNNLKKL
ncbi:inter-alpha-trypsin inhibitor heavy chain H2 [Polypterus senegalus]|uniref:inter-alpha-trypsin inhibitor heavy chain H2 n=1 Tax=Polypterus senegalus TaxID=55291 RepID=UPI0019634EEA|nr:inter-alpha-trypsin inhibitor heavy chain H2 [Polypterus senegalus]